jgi:PAS domain S-box-containing protein
MATAPDQRASISQAFLAAIVESSDDAIVSKDLNGIIATWNKGAERIFGYTAEEAVGQPMAMVIPERLHGEEMTILSRLRRGERIEHYETLRRRKDGTLLNISLTISPIRNAEGLIVGISKIARDITQRKQAESLLHQQTQRLEALNRVAQIIASDLELDRTVQRVADIATNLTGAKYGAFFYNVTHRGRGAYLLFTLSGAPREAFEKFGLPRATAVFEPTFKGTGVVRSADIRNDPRYGKNQPHRGMPDGHLPVVSYLAVPVISRTGEVIGGLFFGHDDPGVFTQAAEDMAVAIAAHAAVAIDNARLYEMAQEESKAKELLLDEFKHRMKNSLTMVQVIATQTLQGSPRQERETFIGRLHAMAHAQDALTGHTWDRASVRHLVEAAASLFAKERFSIEGTDTEVQGNGGLYLSMALHELMTNAIKHGALSDAEGSVRVSWSVDGETLLLYWQELGGPPVQPPTRIGFGSLLIRQATAGDTQFDFTPEGMSCRLRFALRR